MGKRKKEHRFNKDVDFYLSRIQNKIDDYKLIRQAVKRNRTEVSSLQVSFCLLELIAHV